MKNARDDADMKKFMDDLAAVDFDDLEDDFRGVTVDAAQWEKYQTIVRALLTAQDEGGGKILKVDYLDSPDPLSRFAAAMIVMPSAFWFDGEVSPWLGFGPSRGRCWRCCWWVYTSCFAGDS